MKVLKRKGECRGWVHGFDDSIFLRCSSLERIGVQAYRSIIEQEVQREVIQKYVQEPGLEN